MWAYLIFVIFSPHTHSLVNFFSTQKRVNCDKTNLRQKCVNYDKTKFTTKNHEFHTFGGILIITLMPDVEKLQISPHLSYGKISNFKFIMHRNLKFLHLKNFSPHISLVILATSMRYGTSLPQSVVL